MNGYFRLWMNELGTFVKLFPETDGGERLEVGEVAEYLEFHQLSFDLKELRDGIVSGKETLVPLTKEKKLPVNERAVITVAPDRLSAEIRFYAPSNEGSVMDKKEIMGDIAYQNIVFGVQEDVIDRFVENREYCKTYVIAIGEKVVPPKDAEIEYFFNTDLRVRPTLKEDGSVDFFNLNIMNHCKEGDLLAKLHTEVMGEDGVDVYGEFIPAPLPKKKTIRFGRNMTLSEDKTELYSDVNGHVSLVEDRVFVSNVYEVENVDNGTGNIEYDGSVKISGNVCANFSVKAKGDIVVDGVVEGAYLEAGGNIIIGRGMNGMERGILKAEGNVVAKFLENATVSAKGYIETESILHSKVMAGTEITVTGKRAFITGGTVSALKQITAKTLGSQMAAATTIEVGIDPNSRARVQDLQKEIMELQQSIKKIDPVLEASIQKIKQGIKMEPEQLSYMRTLAEKSKEMHRQLTVNMREAEELQDALDNNADASVVVTGVAYPGTKIVISGASVMIKEAYKYCRYKKVRGDVKAQAI